jgi:flagellar hook protein FlgE
VTDIDGNETERPFQAWAEYDAAQVTIAGATDLTNNFETVRRGKPAETLPVMKTVEETITDEEGNESTRSVEVVDDEAEPTANPEFAEWEAAWTPVNGALNG